VKVSSLIAEQERQRASTTPTATASRTTARLGTPPQPPARPTSPSSPDALRGPTGTQPLPTQPDKRATAPKPPAYDEVLRSERDSITVTSTTSPGAPVAAAGADVGTVTATTTTTTTTTTRLADTARLGDTTTRTVPIRTPPPAGPPVPVDTPAFPQPPSAPQIATTTPSAFGLPIVGVRAATATVPLPTQRTPPTPPVTPPVPAAPQPPLAYAPAPAPPQAHASAPAPPPYAAVIAQTSTPLTSLPPAPMVPPVLVDVTPRALVVETAGGWCDVVVPRNAKIPCERTRAFSTSTDMQTVVRIRVGQGEEAVFGQNTLLGEIELSSLRPAPRGEVTIQLRFEVDESGTLNVAAIDLASGREAHATLQLVGIAGASSVASMRARQAGMRVQ
jgi:hypothetical protein